MLRLFLSALLTFTLGAPLHVSAQRQVLLPGLRPEAFATIDGSARDSVNRPLPGAVIRLRDVRLGRTVETQRTDRDGLFAFGMVDPGNYVVEIVAENGAAVLAASQVLNVNAGDVASTVVRLPFEARTVLGVSPLNVGTIAAESALAGILLINIAGTATCDTLQ